MANVQRYAKRWPAGHPLGGRFMPRNASVSGGITPPPQLMQFQARARASLNHPFAQALAGQMGVRPEQLRQLNARLVEHATRLIAVVAHSRPEAAAKMAQSGLSWGDFGDAPLAAWYDPDSRTIILNPRHAFGPNGTTEGVLRNLTHEMAHLLDESVGNGKPAFTREFEPLHRWIEGRVKRRGLESWLYWTRLAYPATGFYGLANGLTADLSGEYISVLSELHWHHPDDLARLQLLLDSDGYQGPPLRELMARIWGGAPPPPQGAIEVPEVWLERFDGRSIGLKRPGEVVRWRG